MSRKLRTTNVSEINVISKKVRNEIIAAYEAAKAAEAAAAEAAAAEAAAAEKAAAEAEAAAQKAAQKEELKLIQKGKKAVDNFVLSELLPFDVAFKYAIADIQNNGIMHHLKTAQKAVFNENQYNQLVKSLNLCLKQFSNDDLQKYVSDNKCTLPSKFITAIVNGSCKSAKAFDNSKSKELPKNEKLS